LKKVDPGFSPNNKSSGAMRTTADFFDPADTRNESRHGKLNKSEF
jgi:hypothetical protein